MNSFFIYHVVDEYEKGRKLRSKNCSFWRFNPDMTREIWSKTKNLEFQNCALLDYKTTQFESSVTANN